MALWAGKQMTYVSGLLGVLAAVGLWWSLSALTPSPSGTPEPAQTLRTLAEDLDMQVGFFTGFEPMDPARDTYDPAFVELLKTARHEFNLVTAPTYMALVAPERGAYDLSGPDIVVEWAEKNGLAVHGHPLVWHNPGVLPDWVKALEKKGAYSELKQVLKTHVETLVRSYRGRVSVWDVVNEGIGPQGDTWGYRQNVWQSAFQAEPAYGYLDAAFVWARENDPEAALIYNDHGVATLNPKSDFMFEMVKGMQARGIPLDGVGFQMHLAADGGPLKDAAGLESFRRNLSRFAALGLDIYITEFDMNLRSSSPEAFAQQAEVVQAVLNHCVNEPRCKAFQTWGLLDKYTWLDRFNNEERIKTYPLLFGVEGHPKPAYEAARRALQGLEGSFRLQNRWTGRYLNATEEVRADVTTFDDRPTWTSQRWHLEPVERGVYRLRNHWGYYLDAPDGNGDVTVTRPNELWWGQQWHAESIGESLYRFRNRWTGDYLHASTDVNGASVLSAASNPEWTSQQWRLEPLSR